MYDLRVLITTYHEAFLRRGGGEQELVETAQRLNELGVEADIYGPQSKAVDGYDVVLHFSVHGGGLELLRMIAQAGKPIALWPNLWLTQADAIPQDLIQAHVDLAAKVVIKSQAESEHLQRIVRVPPERLIMVPSGVDRSYGIEADAFMFKTIYQLDEYLLWPGIIEEHKNQLVAIRALHDLSTPIVFVGNCRDKEYYEACRREAPPHFRFLPSMPPKSEIYRSAMQNCRLFLEAPLDHPGLSALEGALAGCALVISDGPWSREHFGDQVIYVDPTKPESIRDGVAKGLQAQPNPATAAMVRQRHLLPECLKPLVEALAICARP